MGAVAIGALLIAVLLAIVSLMVLQAARRNPVDEPAFYVVGDAARFVHDRLSDRSRATLVLDEVWTILEWQLTVHQVEAPRDGGERPIVGSGDSLEYLMKRAEEAGHPYDVLDLAEVIAADTEYLLSIGAIGEPVEEA